MVFGVFFCGLHSPWEADTQASREGHESWVHFFSLVQILLLRPFGRNPSYELTKNFSKILNLRFSFGWIIVIALHQLQLRLSKKNQSYLLGFFFFDTKILLGPRCYGLISKGPCPQRLLNINSSNTHTKNGVVYYKKYKLGCTPSNSAHLRIITCFVGDTCSPSTDKLARKGDNPTYCW